MNIKRGEIHMNFPSFNVPCLIRTLFLCPKGNLSIQVLDCICNFFSQFSLLYFSCEEATLKIHAVCLWPQKTYCCINLLNSPGDYSKIEQHHVSLEVQTVCLYTSLKHHWNKSCSSGRIEPIFLKVIIQKH